MFRKLLANRRFGQLTCANIRLTLAGMLASNKGPRCWPVSGRDSAGSGKPQQTVGKE